MPVNLTGYRVFIASPAGLDDERVSFRRTLASYNESDALARGVLFIPVGWEETLGGIGRPQGIINEDVRTSDFLVLVLCDRWGTPPQHPSRAYTSGTEEEYNIALECCSRSDYPMREVLVFFKSVDIQRLSDPGPQLSKVLAFRRGLEQQKQLLFTAFDDKTAFEQRLRSHLADWMRKHEKNASSPTRSTLAMTAIDMVPSVLLPSASLHLKEADELAGKGKRIDAELAFARANAGPPDVEALYRYGKFLVEDGRFTDAERVLERAARQRPETTWTALALHQSGLIWRERRQLEKAEKIISSSLELANRLKDQALVGRNFYVLGSLEYYQDHPGRARRFYMKALEIATKNQDEDVIARVYYNLAIISKNKQTASDLKNKARVMAERHKLKDLHSLILLNDALDTVDGASALLAIEDALVVAASGSQSQLAHVQTKAGEIYIQFGKRTKARRVLRSAQDLATRLGLTYLKNDIQRSLRQLTKRRPSAGFVKNSSKGQPKRHR